MRPGDFALGSPQSRAAARVILERRLASRKMKDVILVSSIPRPDGTEITIGQSTQGEDGRLTLQHPFTGLTMDEAERMAGALAEIR